MLKQLSHLPASCTLNSIFNSVQPTRVEPEAPWVRSMLFKVLIQPDNELIIFAVILSDIDYMENRIPQKLLFCNLSYHDFATGNIFRDNFYPLEAEFVTYGVDVAPVLTDDLRQFFSFSAQNNANA